jgi:hypothetical protein
LSFFCFETRALFSTKSGGDPKQSDRNPRDPLEQERKRNMGRSTERAILAALVALIASPASAEPACADPSYTLAERSGARSPATLTAFSLVGAELSVVATGRFALADTRQRGDDLEEALEMRKVLPGYPQPALVTFDLKLAF